MTTLAIVGAGPGLGAATARRFGAEGFQLALISRHQDRVDTLAAELTDTGVTARRIRRQRPRRPVPHRRPAAGR